MRNPGSFSHRAIIATKIRTADGRGGWVETFKVGTHQHRCRIGQPLREEREVRRGGQTVGEVSHVVYLKGSPSVDRDDRLLVRSGSLSLTVLDVRPSAHGDALKARCTETGKERDT